MRDFRLPNGAPWYVSNRQIHEDLDVPLFADHIRALTASFDSKLADVGSPLLRQLGKYADRGLSPSSDAKFKGGRGQQFSRGHRPRWSSRLNESRSALISREPFGYPDWGFSAIFLSSTENARVYDAKSGHGPHSPPPGDAAASPKRLEKSRISPVCDRASLGSKPRQPTRGSLSLP